MVPWVGIIAPAGTPKPIVEHLTRETLVVMTDPAVIKQFADGGRDPRRWHPAAMRIRQ
jgi:tripartite-type tricarboxylate transporter receptor subunit TctC